MVANVRARSPQARQTRQEAILARTLALWRGGRYEDVTLQAVAEGIGLTKAALYGYFATKESLFLRLYETLLAAFLSELQRHLRLGGTHSPRSLAALVGTLLAEHPDLTRLMPHLAGVLERNIPPERALEHKRWLLGALAPVTAALEAALPELEEGGGLRLLTYTQALVAGLQPMADPAPAVAAVLAEDDLAPLRVGLPGALPDALGALYAGLVAR